MFGPPPEACLSTTRCKFDLDVFVEIRWYVFARI
jgi:hypothetical protein